LKSRVTISIDPNVLDELDLVCTVNSRKRSQLVQRCVQHFLAGIALELELQPRRVLVAKAEVSK